MSSLANLIQLNFSYIVPNPNTTSQISHTYVNELFDDSQTLFAK